MQHFLCSRCNSKFEFRTSNISAFLLFHFDFHVTCVDSQNRFYWKYLNEIKYTSAENKERTGKSFVFMNFLLVWHEQTNKLIRWVQYDHVFFFSNTQNFIRHLNRKMFCFFSLNAWINEYESASNGIIMVSLCLLQGFLTLPFFWQAKRCYFVDSLFLFAV